MHIDLATIQRTVGGMQGKPANMRRYGPSDVLFPSPRITAALRFGTPQRRTFLGDVLMPDFLRGAWKVLVISEGTEHLFVHDTERALSEPRKRGTFVQSTTEFEMARYGLEFGLDRTLVTRIAEEAFQLRVGAARRAEAGVRLDIENRKALLLSTLANWPAAHRADESGTPWDGVGGDVKARFKVGIAQVQSVHPGYQVQDFNTAMSQDGWEATLADTAWLAVRSGTVLAAVEPDVSDFEKYVGLRPGSVTVGDATVSTGGTVQSLWGETVILHLNVDVAELDTTFGSDVFSLNHVMNGGNAFPPYFEDRPTTDWYPFEQFALPVVHDFTTGFFFDGMKA